MERHWFDVELLTYMSPWGRVGGGPHVVAALDDASVVLREAKRPIFALGAARSYGDVFCIAMALWCAMLLPVENAIAGLQSRIRAFTIQRTAAFPKACVSVS